MDIKMDMKIDRKIDMKMEKNEGMEKEIGMETLKFAHLSDLHLVGGEMSTVLERALELDRDPRKNVEKCLAMLQEERPDFVLMTGDCIHEGRVEDYRRLKDMLDEGLPGIPVFVSLGNHDRRKEFREGFLGEAEADNSPYWAKAEWRGLRILSLDSAWEKKNGGNFPEEQLEWLEQELQTPSKRGTILLFHHPILRAAGPLGFAPCERLHRLLELDAGEIKAMFNGHIHKSFIGTCHGILQVTADSLGFGAALSAGRLTYHTQAGYHMCQLDALGDLTVERRLVWTEETPLASRTFPSTPNTLKKEEIQC